VRARAVTGAKATVTATGTVTPATGAVTAAVTAGLARSLRGPPLQRLHPKRRAMPLSFEPPARRRLAFFSFLLPSPSPLPRRVEGDARTMLRTSFPQQPPADPRPLRRRTASRSPKPFPSLCPLGTGCPTVSGEARPSGGVPPELRPRPLPPRPPGMDSPRRSGEPRPPAGVPPLAPGLPSSPPGPPSGSPGPPEGRAAVCASRRLPPPPPPAAPLLWRPFGQRRPPGFLWGRTAAPGRVPLLAPCCARRRLPPLLLKRGSAAVLGKGRPTLGLPQGLGGPRLSDGVPPRVWGWGIWILLERETCARSTVA